MSPAVKRRSYTVLKLSWPILRTRSAIAVAAAVVAGAAMSASAHASSVVVLTGRGWGHGVGMSQWGAYGYARHGWSWQRILAHYYPGTTLGWAANARIRVLLAAGQPRVSFACPGPIEVSDVTGRTRSLPAGAYSVGPRLILPLGRHHRGLALPSPVALGCPSAPILWNGSGYHGTLVVRSDGHSLAVVNGVDLEDYLLGVVGSEMPSRWSLDALEAQAVAARSYALATLRPSTFYDLFADTRSQMYEGTAGESANVALAVQRTSGRVLTYQGRIAETFFFSSSGGRTANVRDVWPGDGAIPYLRSVDDPYDVASPHHLWRAIELEPRRIGGASVRLVRTPSGRVASVVVGGRAVGAETFMQRFHLRSTWFDVGELSLVQSSDVVTYGGHARLVARAQGVGTALLQRLDGAGRWLTLAAVRGRRPVAVRPWGHTIYRLTALGVRGPEVAVGVVPRLRVLASAGAVRGSVSPRPGGAVTVLRLVRGTWQTVAHPRIDARGRFLAAVRMRPGAYRVTVGGDRRFDATAAPLQVTRRLLATYRH